MQSLKNSNCDFIDPADHEKDQDPNELILKHRQNISHVIIGGGDGSVCAALPALIETQLPVFVIPLGTANNLARNYNITQDIQSVHTMLTEGEQVSIDVGVVNGVHFLNVAGLGLSTEVNENVSSDLKKKIGVFAFVYTAFKMVTKMNPFRAIITADGGKPIYTKSWQISVCNGKHYGNGLTIKHDASLEDHKLHLLSTEVKKWWHSVGLISSLITGHYKKTQEITLIAGRDILIETRRTFRIDVDGDVKTTTPATFSVIPKAVNLIIPRRET